MQKDKTKEEFIEEIRLLQKRIAELEISVNKQQQQQQKLSYFKKAVDSATDAIGMSTAEGRHYYQNEAFTKLFGLSVSEIDGVSGPPSSIYVDEKVGRKVFDTIMRGDSFTGEVKMLTIDKSEKDIFLRAYSIKDKEGKVIGLVGIHTDITERKKAEVALRDSEKRFMDVMYVSKDAILLIDANIFIDCNEATLSMLGYSTRKEFLMVHPSKLSPDIQPDGKRSFDKAEDMMKIAIEKGYNRFEWVHRKANGEDFLVEVSLTPVAFSGKTIIHCIWRDLTEVKKTEKADHQHIKELEVFYKAAVGREERIIELKKEVESLKKELGK